MTEQFKRENRYLVIKREDIAKYLREPQQQRLYGFADEIVMRRIEDGKTDHGYVVVSDDWPEYETVFKMIEARVTGQPNELQSLTARLEAAEKEVKTSNEVVDFLQLCASQLTENAQNQEINLNWARHAQELLSRLKSTSVFEQAAQIEALTNSAAGLSDLVIEKNRQIEALQAKVDALMLEYCPDEITPKQMENWAKHQQAVPAEEAAKINAAINTWLEGKS